MAKQRVLAICGQSENFKIIKKIFRNRDIEVKGVEDASALGWAASKAPGLVIVCAELPRMSGYALVNKLRKSNETKSIPIVLTSSQATEETFAQHKKLSTRANEYLLEPFTEEQMIAAIGRAAPDLGVHPGGGTDELMDDIIDETPSGDSPLYCLSCGASVPVKEGWKGNLSEQNIDEWSTGLCPSCGSGMLGLRR